MEESLTLLGRIKREFQCGEVDVRTYSPLALAYIGDGIYELIVRSVVVERANRPARQLHSISVGFVKAGTQAAMGDALQDRLTEGEAAVYKRGRNAKPGTTAKNATAEEYHKATAFEALLGYLYLTDNMDRALELVKAGLAAIDKKL